MSILTCIIIAIIASTISIVLVGIGQWVAQTRFKATRAKRNASEEAEAAAEEAEVAAEEAADPNDLDTLLLSKEKEAQREYIGTCAHLFILLQKDGGWVGLSHEETYWGCVTAPQYFDLQQLKAKLEQSETTLLRAYIKWPTGLKINSRLLVWTNMAIDAQRQLKWAREDRVNLDLNQGIDLTTGQELEIINGPLF